MPRIRADSIEAHKQLTRREILDAAEDLFRSQGYQGTSLGDIASSVGIGRTTLYEYYQDKEDLLASLVESTLPGTIDDMIAGLDPAESPARRLGALAGRMVEFVATDPTLGLILHRAVPRLSQEAQDRVRSAHGDLAREFLHLYRDGVEADEFRSMPADVAARLIHDVIMSGAKVLIDSPDPSLRLEEVTGAVRTFLIGGLSSGSADC